jgi:GNAT superfamily N-acetyltransferase
MYTIERIEPSLTDEVACDINAFENGLAAELDPAVPPLPVSATKAYAKHWDPSDIEDAYAVRAADGTVVGTAWMSAPRDDNLHVSFTRLGVASAHRRQGVATKLFGAFVGFAAEHDRTTLLLGADIHHPAADGFAASLGATTAMRAHVNQLLLADVPDGLVEHWIASANSATGAVHDYELQWVPDSECPDEWLADLAVVTDVLQNDAPMDDIPIGERHTTPEQLRAHAERTRAFGRDWWTLIARHRATGEPVGYTEMFFPQENPKLGSQGATAVSAKHRGYALGRWLKATMLQRLLEEKPDITTIRTFNADSNDPMLAINFAMGFKNLYAAARWMIERADAETWLEKRT